MAKIDNAQVLHQQLIDATKTVRQFAGSDCSRAVLTMLDALAVSYFNDLIDVEVDGLVALQSRIKQVYAIRAIVANDGQDIPKI